jgi:hypothetical protein
MKCDAPRTNEKCPEVQGLVSLEGEEDLEGQFDRHPQRGATEGCN